MGLRSDRCSCRPVSAQWALHPSSPPVCPSWSPCPRSASSPPPPSPSPLQPALQPSSPSPPPLHLWPSELHLAAAASPARPPCRLGLWVWRWRLSSGPCSCPRAPSDPCPAAGGREPPRSRRPRRRACPALAFLSGQWGNQLPHAPEWRRGGWAAVASSSLCLLSACGRKKLVLVSLSVVCCWKAWRGFYSSVLQQRYPLVGYWSSEVGMWGLLEAWKVFHCGNPFWTSWCNERSESLGIREGRDMDLVLVFQSSMSFSNWEQICIWFLFQWFRVCWLNATIVRIHFFYVTRLFPPAVLVVVAFQILLIVPVGL